MTTSITLIYAILLGLTYVVLSYRVIGQRQRKKISIGDGGDPDLQRRIRVHANFAEYTPIGLILIFLLEDAAFSPATIHTFGISLLAGRLIHAWGLGSSPEILAARVTGMVLSFAVILGAALLAAARLGFGVTV